MKKVFELMFSLIILFSLSITVSAADTTWTSTKEVELPKGQNQFNVQITVDQAKAYAGAEFGVQTPDGVSIRSVTYSQNSSKVAPTEARGLTWFSYYSGNNDFKGKVTATLTLEYKGTENTSIVIDNISVYTKDGTAVDTAKVTPRKIIEISRDGANNPIIPLEPPTDSNSPTGSSNTDNTTSNTSGTTKLQTTKNSSTKGTNASTVSTTSTTSTTDASNNLNEDQTDLNDDDIDENEEENNSDNILEANDENTSKAQKDPLNTIILIVLIISIISNAVIGYFYIKNKNKIKEK